MFRIRNITRIYSRLSWFICIKFLEKKIPAGLDLIVIIVLGAPLVRGIAAISNPLVETTLQNIGGVITATSTASPIMMGIIRITYIITVLQN